MACGSVSESTSPHPVSPSDPAAHDGPGSLAWTPEAAGFTHGWGAVPCVSMRGGGPPRDPQVLQVSHCPLGTPLRKRQTRPEIVQVGSDSVCTVVRPQMTFPQLSLFGVPSVFHHLKERVCRHGFPSKDPNTLWSYFIFLLFP